MPNVDPTVPPFARERINDGLMNDLSILSPLPPSNNRNDNGTLPNHIAPLPLPNNGLNDCPLHDAPTSPTSPYVYNTNGTSVNLANILHLQNNCLNQGPSHHAPTPTPLHNDSQNAALLEAPAELTLHNHREQDTLPEDPTAPLLNNDGENDTSSSNIALDTDILSDFQAQLESVKHLPYWEAAQTLFPTSDGHCQTARVSFVVALSL